MTTHPYIRVSEVMTKPVRTIDRMATARDALRMLAESRVSSLVIERRDERDELGIVVISDIARHVIAQDRSPDRVNIYEIMSKPVLTIDRDMDIRYAIRLLDQFNLSRGLVVDHDRTLLGIVTLRDMVVRYANVVESLETVGT
ncbi:MAG: CBS domain-containing protein [Proteobacteria bacterium]|nr:CBS domain-containing protein [Pseudomonadota bacterium]